MANSKFKIDPEFVPIPSFHTVKEAKKSDWQILFESISHGQSFVCDKKIGLTVRSSFAYWNKKMRANKVLVTRSINDNKDMRCWVFKALPPDATA